MANIVYPHGVKKVTLAAAEKITVFSQEPVKIYQNVKYPNQPESWDLLETTEATETYLSSAFTNGGEVRIEAGASDVFYEVGANPLVTPVGKALFQMAAPTAKADGAAVLTAVQMINGIVVHTVTTGRTLTTPTGAAITAGLPSTLKTGDCFKLHVITLGAGADDISTLTAGDGNVTFVGNVTVGPEGSTFNNYGTWIFRYSGSNAWVGYRVG